MARRVVVPYDYAKNPNYAVGARIARPRANTGAPYNYDKISSIHRTLRRTHPRASLRELKCKKFCRHQAVYSPAGTAKIVVSTKRGDSKGGHTGVSPFGVFFFCHFFLHKQKEMARNLFFKTKTMQ